VSRKYDLIVCNPPFFKDPATKLTAERAMARHDHRLSLEQLFSSSSGQLGRAGRLQMILPAGRYEEALSCAGDHFLFLRRITYVKPTPLKPPGRILMDFAFEDAEVLKDELIIEEAGRHGYSEAYKRMTDDFYL
jgi:tRNA1Val (adenine37-N6)-methyltransferase